MVASDVTEKVEHLRKLPSCCNGLWRFFFSLSRNGFLAAVKWFESHLSPHGCSRTEGLLDKQVTIYQSSVLCFWGFLWFGHF